MFGVWAAVSVELINDADTLPNGFMSHVKHSFGDGPMVFEIDHGRVGVRRTGPRGLTFSLFFIYADLLVSADGS